ncbi:hypothetical protein ACJJTC_007645 [Scirpophaga incertulas]
MTREEAENKRQVWRKEKQASRQKKRQSVQDSVNVAPNDNLQFENIASASQIHCIKSIQYLKKKNTYLTNKCRRFMTYNIKLKRQKETYKKRNQRLLKQNKDEVNYLETELLKIKARNEMLEHTLKKTYQNCTKRTEKQTLKRLVKNSENKKIITKMLDAYEVCKECLKKTKVFLILKSHIDNIAKLLPAKLPVLKGTMQLHQIITDKNDKFKIAYRDVSCFCGEQRGRCECFSPKPHYVIDPRITLDGMDGINLVDSFLLSSVVMNLPLDQTVDTRINDEQTTAEVGSNTNQIIDTLGIIDTMEFPIINVQQLEEYLPKNESSSTNESQIKILEERRFFPKSKKVLTEMNQNSVIKIIPSTQCCKIQTKGIQCQKCVKTISGLKGTCMVCKKINIAVNVLVSKYILILYVIHV